MTPLFIRFWVKDMDATVILMIKGQLLHQRSYLMFYDKGSYTTF